MSRADQILIESKKLIAQLKALKEICIDIKTKHELLEIEMDTLAKEGRDDV